MTTRPQRKPVAKRSGAKMTLDQMLARREREDAMLRKELAKIEDEIADLDERAASIRLALGIEQEISADPAAVIVTPVTNGTLAEAGFPDLAEAREESTEQSVNTPKFARQRKCADCGAYVPGPNERGDCPRCGAGPFEDAR